MKTLKNIIVADKRVLLRCEFDVPLDGKGNILDDFRIMQSLETIKYLVKNRAKIILTCHLGRPDGKVVPELRVNKIAEVLAQQLNMTIAKTDDCVGPEIESETNSLKPGEIMLLENLRFHKEEQSADQEFAKKLARLGDIYVNDAFGVCHRNNASITGVPQFLASFAGFLLEKEVETLDKIMKKPDKPMVAVIGGTKVETKAKFIDNISNVADYVIVSGLIAKEIAEKNVKFKYSEKIVSPVGDLGALDINEDSIKIISEKIMSPYGRSPEGGQAKTVLWNGPFGKFEEKKYEKGSLAIAEAIIKSGAFSVVGGGETVEFLNKQGMINKFSWVSTGGGAMLAYLSGDKLPGIEALK